MRPVLSNGLVKIRCYEPTDVPLLFEAVRESIAEVSRWLSWCHPDYAIEESLEWVLKCQKSWDDGLEYNFAIFDLSSETLVGSVGLNQLDRQNRLANLGYWVRKGWTGRGIATAATQLAAKFGFRELGLTRLEITAAVENKGSQKVAQKLGAVREGVLRKRLVVNGKSYDAVISSLLANEWSA
jgi:ribosomal-protein-serine acetyltransferase